MTLKGDAVIDLKIENTQGNSTMRVDSLRLIPSDSPLYSECIIMNMNVPTAYVRGKMTAENTVPVPRVISGKLYLPKIWTQAQLDCVIDGEEVDIGGVVYASADGLPSSVDAYSDAESGTVVIYPSDICSNGKITAAASELF